MDKVKLKKLFSDFYLERLTLEEAYNSALELFNCTESTTEVKTKDTLPDEWSVWCGNGNEGVFRETVIHYLNNKYNSDWQPFGDRFYGESYMNGEYRVCVSNIPVGRLLTFEEFQSMVDYNLTPKVDNTNSTYPLNYKY